MKRRRQVTVESPVDAPDIEIESIPFELHEKLLKIESLERELRSVKEQLKTEKEKKCPCSKLFRSDQLRFLAIGTVKGRGYSWSEETIRMSLKLRFSCGASGYDDLLKHGFPLPALRTLQKRTEHIQFESGVLTEVFDMLEQKALTLNEQERWCSLTMDEMSIRKSIDYDVKSDSFMGYVTLPGHDGEASKALCVQLGGLATRWKQTVAYHFTGNSVNGKMLGPILKEDIMARAHKIGLKVSSITNDFGSSNLACWS